jgi:hypothetical protein
MKEHGIPFGGSQTLRINFYNPNEESDEKVNLTNVNTFERERSGLCSHLILVMTKAHGSVEIQVGIFEVNGPIKILLAVEEEFELTLNVGGLTIPNPKYFLLLGQSLVVQNDVRLSRQILSCKIPHKIYGLICGIGSLVH